MTEVVKAVDKFVVAHQKERMAGFVVLLAKSSEENLGKLRALAKANSLTIPTGIAFEGAAGPRSYKLNPKVPLLVLAANRDTCKGNFPFGDADPEDTDALAKQIEQILTAAQEMLKTR